MNAPPANTPKIVTIAAMRAFKQEPRNKVEIPS